MNSGHFLHRGAESLRQPDGLDHHVGTLTIGEFRQPLMKVFPGGVDRMGGARGPRRVQFFVIPIDAYGLGASKAGSSHGAESDAAAAQDRDRIFRGHASRATAWNPTVKGSTRHNSLRVSFAG